MMAKVWFSPPKDVAIQLNMIVINACRGGLVVARLTDL